MTLHPDPWPLRIDEEGVIRVGKSRVTLDVVVDDYQSGLSPEEIARQLDTLNLADIYGALAYYFRHQEEPGPTHYCLSKLQPFCRISSRKSVS